MASDEKKKQVPIKEGLFKPPDDNTPGYLIGSKCKGCGEYFHPARVVCANCYNENLEEVALNRRGRIYTFCITRTGYPDAPVTPPFITAQVELPEKVHVLTHVTGIDLDKVQIVQEVELYFCKTGEDEEKNEIMAYAFRPIAS